MKRSLKGKFEVIGTYPVYNTKSLLVLSWNLAKVWEDRKGNSSIALC